MAIGRRHLIKNRTALNSILLTSAGSFNITTNQLGETT